MAITTTPATNTTSTTNTNGRVREEAKGFLNLKIQDSAGNWHTISATIPLVDSNRVHKGLVNKATEDSTHEFKIMGTVNIVSKEEVNF